MENEIIILGIIVSIVGIVLALSLVIPVVVDFIKNLNK